MDVVGAAAILRGDPNQSPRFRQATVTAIAADGTLSVTIGGDSTVITGVKRLARCSVKVGAAVWIATDGRDLFAMDALAPIGPAYCHVRRTTDQTIADDGSAHSVVFGSPPGDLVDPWSIFSGNQTVTIPIPGLWLVSFGYTFAAHATGYRQASLLVGATTFQMERKPAISGAPTIGSICAPVVCSQGDVITVEVRQTSGGALALTGGAAYQSRLEVVYLGPA